MPANTLPDSQHESAPEVTRRGLLTFAVSAPVATVGAGFAISFAMPSTAHAAALPLTPPDTTDTYDVGDAISGAAMPTMALVKLSMGTDGHARLELPRLEVGQGIAPAVAMLLAEELDLPLSMVDVPAADAQPELVFNQISGGSAGVRTFDQAMPLLAAALRFRLLSAAAAQWSVPVASLRVEGGVVIASDGRSAGYGSFAVAASAMPMPSAVVLKSVSQYSLIGKATGRIDARDIVTGRKRFTMDQPVPGAKPTMLRMPSQIRGTVVNVNNLGAVRAMPGVIDVVVIPPGGTIVPRQVGVAVMADTFGQACDACRALDITWGDGPLKGQSNATVMAQLKAANLPLALPPLGALTVDGEFEFAPAAHAPLEVECAIADVRAGRCEIWAGLQTPIVTLQAIAADLGLPEAAVQVHVVPSGGSFGRRLFWDPVQIAAYVSQATGRVCKLMYSRTDDTRHARLRPPQVHKVRATMLLNRVLSFEHRVAAVRLDTRHGFGEKTTALSGALPPTMGQTLGNLTYEQAFFKIMPSSPYNYGVSTRTIVPVAIDLNTAAFRSVHIQPVRSVEEIVTDEIARSLGKDPVALRLECLRLERAKAVLQRCASAASWGKAMPAGFAQGVGVHQESRSFTACIVELDGRDPRNAMVTRATIVIDVGKPINPSGIEAQMLGGLADSIALVLNAGLTLQDGLPLESSYAQYRYTKMKDFPKDVQVILMPNVGNPTGGLGEVGLSASSGAIANAYARATGVRPRRFPLNAAPAFTPVAPGQLPAPVFV
jgi:isoquinoline 1-oxidoreductase beta subunit